MSEFQLNVQKHVSISCCSFKYNKMSITRKKCATTSGVARLRADNKSAALSTPQICLQEFKMKEDHVSCS